MFTDYKDEYVPPERTLDHIRKLLEFARKEGWTEAELYYVLKLTIQMFD